MEWKKTPLKKITIFGFFLFSPQTRFGMSFHSVLIFLPYKKTPTICFSSKSGLRLLCCSAKKETDEVVVLGCGVFGSCERECS